MTTIDANTVVVIDSNELKDILEQNNNINLIYLGANIKLTQQINILPTKQKVVIDGTFENIRYTFEDIDASSNLRCIGVRGASSIEVTIQNMDINGRNYYGIIFVQESEDNRNTIVNFINVKYEGPQMVINMSGLVRFIDCTITIKNGYSPAHEVAELNRVEIGGVTNILHTITTGNSIFWFRGSTQSYLTILKNAKVNMVSDNRELFYGKYNLIMTFEENSDFNLTAHNGVCYNDFSASSVLIDQNANVYITQTARNGSYATWYCTGPFTMNKGSKLHIICNYAGMGSSNYCLRFTTTSASLVLNDPEEVVLYNRYTRTIYTATLMSFTFDISQINKWNAAKEFTSAGDIYDIPNYSWYKLDNSNSLLTGTINTNSTTLSSNNYTSSELEELSDLSFFNLHNAPVLSIGKIPLNIFPITTTTTNIEGRSLPSTDVLIEYNGNKIYVKTNDEGLFSYTLDAPLPEGTKISFTANISNTFIYSMKKVTIVYPGELTLDYAPALLTFQLSPMRTDPVICPRSQICQILVTDSRAISSDWKLYALIEHNLISENNHTLTDALIYSLSPESMNILNTTTPILVYTGENNNGIPKTTQINWAENQGVLLKLNTEPLVIGETYRTHIIWILEE